MSYLIYTSAGTPITIPDDAIDTTYYNASGGGGFGPGNVPQAGQGLGTQIVGRNTIDYGAAIAQNFLQLQENFASSSVPSDLTSLQGQLWFKQTSVTTGDLYVRRTANTSGGISNWTKILVEGGGGGGAGTVTSVGISGANGIGVASSPVTTSGTIALSLGNITPTTVSTGNVTTSGNIIFSGTDQKITGNLSGSTNAFKFQSNIVNGNTILPILPNGTGTTGVLAAWNSSSTDNGAFITVGSTSTSAGLDVGKAGTGAALDLLLSSQGLRGVNVTTTGNVVVGGTGALATTATDRFLYLNSMAGVPTGVPTVPTGYTAAGKVPITVDTTNNALYFYSSGAWRSNGLNFPWTTVETMVYTSGVSYLNSYSYPIQVWIYSETTGNIIEVYMGPTTPASNFVAKQGTAGGVGADGSTITLIVPAGWYWRGVGAVPTNMYILR